MTVTSPPLLSAPRLTTLFASLLVALCSGTSYVYSAYSPQLGAHLNINHTILNIIGLNESVGISLSAPGWGRIVDSRGPRILLAAAFLLLFTGYWGTKYIFDAGVPPNATTISTFTIILLVLFACMIGTGSSASITGAVNSTAKSFPDKARGTATGIVISGYGLSAFVFSATSRVTFAGDTSSLLRLLALGTALPMVISFFLVRPIPLPPPNTTIGLEPLPRSAVLFNDEEEERLLGSDDVNDSMPLAVQLSPQTTLNDDLLPNVYGKELFTSGDFWLLCSILTILSGTGVMYINNVGSMSQVLYYAMQQQSGNQYDPIKAAHWQADQVSAISLMNFSGRIVIGLVSDFAKNRLAFPRSYCLVLVSFLCFASQIVAANVDDIKHLYLASAFLGFGYGSVFSLFPNVCLEWFGLPHFSENWGYMVMAPIAGNLFSIIFGRNLDSHNSTVSSSVAAGGAGLAPPLCHMGRRCYVDTLYLTMLACFMSMGLSVWAGWRDRRKVG